MQDYGKCSVWPFIAVHYNDQVQAPMQGHSMASVGTSERSIILAK
jgi:hypothetical protein